MSEHSIRVRIGFGLIAAVCAGLWSVPAAGGGFSEPPLYLYSLNDTLAGFGPCLPNHPVWASNCVDPDGDGPLEWGDGHQWTGNQYGIAFDSLGNYYVADQGMNEVRKFDSSNRMILKWETQYGFRDAFDVDVDSDDNVWVSNRRSGYIEKFDTDGSPLSGSIYVGGRIKGIHIDRYDRIFVAIDASRPGEIQRFDNGYLALTISPIHNPIDMATDSQGNIWVIDSSRGYDPDLFVKKFNPIGVLSAAYNTPQVPLGIAIDSEDRIYLSLPVRFGVVVHDTGFNELFWFGIRDNKEYELWTSSSMAFTPDEDMLYVSDRGGARFVVFGSMIEDIREIIDVVDELVQNGSLPEGEANALIVKLEHSVAKLDAGKIPVAINQLRAFRNQVESLMVEGVLPWDEGAELIEAVDAVLEALAALV